MGKEIIPVIYEKVGLNINGKVGDIDKKGKEIVPIKYKQLWFESEGMIRFAE